MKMVLQQVMSASGGPAQEVLHPQCTTRCKRPRGRTLTRNTMDLYQPQTATTLSAPHAESSLRGNWLTVTNLGMLAPDSCCFSFSEGCGYTGPQSKFYQEGCVDDLARYQNGQLSIIGPLGLFSELFGIICGVFIPLGLVIMVCMNKASYHPN